jgi:membrane-associated phospholipid phosphatase
LRTIIVIGVVLTAWFTNVAMTESSELSQLDDHVLAGNGYGQLGDLRLNTDYLRGYALDTRSILLSPLSWGFSGWLKISLIVGITGVLADEEEDIQGWVQEKRNASTEKIARFAKPFGDGRYTLPALGALYCCGYFFESERARRTALLGIESFALTGIFTEAIKHVSHKHRPMSGDLENVLWDGPRFSKANLSFPSGHAASAFTVATVVASEYGDKAIVPPLMYGAATLCALSRVHDNSHWVSDVILGSAIGHFTAKAIVSLHSSSQERRFEVAPVIRDEFAGLSISYRF